MELTKEILLQRKTDLMLQWNAVGGHIEEVDYLIGLLDDSRPDDDEGGDE